VTLAGAIAIGVLNYLRPGIPGALLVALLRMSWVRFMKADEADYSALDVLGRCALAAAPGAILVFRSLAKFQPRRVRPLLD